MVTRKEVAAMAGVSEATVSRVFNGVGPMKEATKQKVLEAAAALNYHPNAIAQNFARRRSGNIGVVLPYVPKVHIFTTYYFAEVLSGIGEQARTSGYDMLLMFRAPGEGSDYSGFFRSHKVDGCVILGATDTPQERAELRKLHEFGYPYCLVNQHYPGEAFQLVDADHVQGSYEAVQHMISQGKRSIAFLNGSPEYSNSGDRWLGYKRAMQEAGLLAPETNMPDQMPQGMYYEGNYSRKSGLRAAQTIGPYLKEGKVDGIFASNDRMAIGLIQGLREQGLQPGTDYSIIGYDDSEAARVTDPPLTTVAVPFFDMGRMAAKLVLERLQQEAVGVKLKHAGQRGEWGQKPTMLETQLIIRQSV
ncbi:MULTISPECIES: LacI family DNA-binding transcriptional regulator [unclassified Paenibacillus]|uniref:LacI family DNA-binding transcriptional regulator n=1 Tax=unclassified Paenibacillus TaxID=185978 RepID=UPI000930C7BA